MKSSTKNVAKGNFHRANGKMKELAGSALDNPRLEREGRSEKQAGKAQKKLGEVKKVLGS